MAPPPLFSIGCLRGCLRLSCALFESYMGFKSLGPIRRKRGCCPKKNLPQPHSCCACLDLLGKYKAYFNGLGPIRRKHMAVINRRIYRSLPRE
jgi:hypothetical protein